MRTRRRVTAPPVTTTLVLAFHWLINRPIWRDESQAVDQIFAGEATNGDAKFYWHTAVLAYFSLVPLALVAALALSNLAQPLALLLLVAPFAGGVYSSALRAATREDRRRFRPSRFSFLHDLAIIGIATAAAAGLAVGL